MPLFTQVKPRFVQLQSLPTASFDSKVYSLSPPLASASHLRHLPSSQSPH